MDLAWKTIGMEDKPILEKYYAYEQSKCCEFSFCNNYLWAPFYEMRYAIIEDMLVFLAQGRQPSVGVPLAKDEASERNLGKVVSILEEYFVSVQAPFQMHLVTEEKFAQLEAQFPGKYVIEYNRDQADYIYEVERMISLSGKKLHGKRNHINKFKENNPNWRYEPLSQENVSACVKMAEEWREKNLCDEKGEKHTEFCVTLRALDEYEQLGLKGGVLRIEDRVVAFTLGEELNRETFVVHIEKAMADIQGAYPMINQQFLVHEASQYKYVNREEDMGEEGLRKAKLSYYPVFLQEKGVVRKNEQ
ncbi:MAG: phosphatidylglycerol lysyltransferase domain-containing protein [Lachnospiraceae bacterium]|nr:phosphatidylglycerol lysyltransferase domain-containing protein [Lachnospiraceae bacterium]MDY3221825.1 phosphatidylglycerol lysyltransferase domain-containing protein [Lachnospiraceae bacterium]